VINILIQNILKKGNLKEGKLEDTPRTLMPFKGEQNSTRREKSRGKLEGDQVTHL
jgi:hypothetical protein